MARADTGRFPFGIITDTLKKYQRRPNPRERKLAEAILYNDNIDEDFANQIIWSIVDLSQATKFPVDMDTTLPAAGQEFAGQSARAPYHCHVQSINGTTTAPAGYLFPYSSSAGLEMQVDADATNGVTGWEITNGIETTSKAAKVIGSLLNSQSIFFECKIKIDDISDVTELSMGFRKAEAFQVAVDNYDELASFNIGADSDGQIEIHTILNGAATVETDTTETDWADADEKTLRIEISDTGKCAFFIDGALPTITTTFTFDAAETIIPYLFLSAESGDPGVSVSEWKAGYL